jgi:hypothetical protein
VRWHRACGLAYLWRSFIAIEGCRSAVGFGLHTGGNQSLGSVGQCPEKRWFSLRAVKEEEGAIRISQAQRTWFSIFIIKFSRTPMASANLGGEGV